MTCASTRDEHRLRWRETPTRPAAPASAARGCDAVRDASPVVALGPGEQVIAQRLMDALDRFNADTTGIMDARELLLTELGQNDELLGGLHGWSWGATCWIESLWVREDMRGSGLGGRLLSAVERLARERGCLQLALETHSFQAPDFYRRHG